MIMDSSEQLLYEIIDNNYINALFIFVDRVNSLKNYF